MESEDGNKDDSNARPGQSAELDYDRMMYMIQNQNKQLGGPLLARTEYQGETSSRGAGDFGSLNSNAARDMAGTNQFSSNTNEVQMYQSQHQEEGGPRSSARLSEQSFKSVVSGEESGGGARDQPYADQSEQTSVREPSRSGGQSSDPQAAQLVEVESDQAIQFLHGHARDESNFLFSKQSQISSRQLVSKMSQDFNELLAAGSPDQLPKASEEEHLLQPTEERNDEDQSEQYQSLKRHIFGSRPAQKNQKSSPEGQDLLELEPDQINEFELKNDQEYEEEPEEGSFHSTEQQSASRGRSSEAPQMSNDYVDKDQPLIQTLAQIQAIMQHHEAREQEQASISISNTYVSTGAGKSGVAQAQYDQIAAEMQTLRQQLLLSRQIIEKDKQMKLRLVLKLKEYQKEIEELRSAQGLLPKRTEIGTQVSAVSTEGGVLVAKEYCDKYSQTLPQLLVSEKLELDSHRAQLPGRATVRQSLVSFPRQQEMISRNHAGGFRSKRYSLLKGRAAPRLFNFESDLTGLRHSCLSARQHKYEFSSFFEMKKGQISNKLERLRTIKSQKLNGQPQVAQARRSVLQHRSGSALLYEEFRTQKTAKLRPESRLSLLNRDWKSQISEENSVVSSPLKVAEMPDKMRSGKQNFLDLDLYGVNNHGTRRPNSYHAGDFDQPEGLEKDLQLKRRNTFVAGSSPEAVVGAFDEADRRGAAQFRSRTARSPPDADRIEEDRKEDETEELKTSFDSDPCPFQQSEDPQAGIDVDSDQLRETKDDQDEPGEKKEVRLGLVVEASEKEGNRQLKVADSEEDAGEPASKIEAGDADIDANKQGETSVPYPAAGAEERKAPRVPSLRALLPGARHLDLSQPVFAPEEPGSPNAGFLNVNIKKNVPQHIYNTTQHTAAFSRTQNLRGQMGKATSLSDLARHKHFASVTAESNQYFWKAKFEELLNEKKKQMKQIHDLNQSIQSSESQMVNMKSQMKSSLQEKEVTIEELMKEIVHCRMQIQQLKRASIAISSELMRSSAGSELSHARATPAYTAQLQPKQVAAAPGSLEAAIKTITESLSTKILRAQKEQHHLKPTKENMLLLQAKRNGKLMAAYAQSRGSPPKQKRAIKTQFQIHREAQLAQRDAPSRQGRQSTGSATKKTKKYIRKHDDQEVRASSRAKASSKPAPKRASDLRNGPSEYRRLPTPIVDSLDPTDPGGEGERERSRSLISLDHIDVANIDESLLRVSGRFSKASAHTADKIKDTADSFALADDIDEHPANEEKQQVMVVKTHNRNPSLSKGGPSSSETANANSVNDQSSDAWEGAQRGPAVTLFAQQQKPPRNLLFAEPAQNPLESLLSINFKNDAVLASRQDATASQPKAAVTRTRDSLSSGQALTYTAQYLKSEHFKRAQQVEAAPPQKTAARPSHPAYAQYGKQPGAAKGKPASAKAPRHEAQAEAASTSRSKSGKLKLKVKKTPLERYGPYLVGAQANTKRKPANAATRSRNPGTVGAAGASLQLPGKGTGAAPAGSSQRSAYLSAAREDGANSARSPLLAARGSLPSAGVTVPGQVNLHATASSQLQEEYFKHLREVQNRSSPSKVDLQSLREQIKTIVDPTAAGTVPAGGLEEDTFDGTATAYRIHQGQSRGEAHTDDGGAQLPEQEQLHSARDRGQGQEQEQLGMLRVYHQASAATQPSRPLVPRPPAATPSPLKPASGKAAKKEGRSPVPAQPVLQRGAWAASRTSLSAKSSASLKPAKPTKVKAYASSRSNAGGSVLQSSGTGKIGRIVPKKSTLNASMASSTGQARKIYSQTSRSIETKFAKFLKGQAPQEASPTALLGSASLRIADIK